MCGGNQRFTVACAPPRLDGIAGRVGWALENHLLHVVSLLAGHNSCPSTAESATTTLPCCVDDKGVQQTEEESGLQTQTSFIQKRRNVGCCKRGKKGRCAHERTEEESDDESSGGPSVAPKGSGKIGWSGQCVVSCSSKVPQECVGQTR